MHIVHVLNKASVTSSAINVMNCSVNRGCSVSLITSSIEPEALRAISSKLDIYILKNNLTSLEGLNELYLLVKKINPSILHSQHAKTGAIIINEIITTGTDQIFQLDKTIIVIS